MANQVATIETAARTLKPGTDPVVSVRKRDDEYAVIFEESGGGIWAAQYDADGRLLFTLWNGRVADAYRHVRPAVLAMFAAEGN